MNWLCQLYTVLIFFFERTRLEDHRQIETVGPDPMMEESLQGRMENRIGNTFRSARLKGRKKKDSGGN